MSRDINEQYEPHDKDWVQEQDSKNKLGEKKKKKTNFRYAPLSLCLKCSLKEKAQFSFVMLFLRVRVGHIDANINSINSIDIKAGIAIGSILA